MAHINVGGCFPTNPFTAVVLARNFKLFPDLDKLAGLRIEVSGKVEEYQGKPQIVVSSKGHLQVVEEKPAKR